MNEKGPHIIITGGGTGGHVIPAIAIAEEIERRGGHARFIGTRDRLEATLVPKAGFDIDYIEVKPMAAGGAFRTLRGVASVPSAVMRSCLLIRRRRPDAAVGVGGYVTGPVLLGAKMMRVPTAVVEQNATVGMANRLLAMIVARAFVTYEDTIGAFPSGVATLTGNPVRSAILAAAEQKRLKASDRKAARKVRVLVMGGSQGASAVDERVPSAMAIAGIQDEATVVHQCGSGREAAVRDAYLAAGIKAEVKPFIDDTASAYEACDLVIARAGATTISELTVMGLPAIFLPYPHHKDRQQEKNAEPMRSAGAAVVLNESTTSANDMAKAISDFVRDDERRLRAAKASFALGRRDAALRIVDGLFDLAGVS